MIGLNEATMYGFALYALTGRFMLHRFAIVFRIPVTKFKSLNSPDWAWVKGFQKGTHEKAYLGGYLKWKNARGYHTDAKCCHAFVKRWNYERNDFSLHHGRLEQPLRVRRTTPLPTTYCHPIANPLLQADNGFTLQAKRIINAKISIRNERSNYLERKV